MDTTLGASRHSYDEILADRAGRPSAGGRIVDYPTFQPPERHAALAYHEGAPEVHGLMVAVDPYTGEVVKSRFWGKTLMSWIYDLHSSLQMGGIGRNTLGIIGLFLMGSLITEVYL